MSFNCSRILLVTALSLAMAGPVSAQVNFTGAAYTQSFDSLPGTTNGSSQVWTNNSTLPGWYASRANYHVRNVVVTDPAGTYDDTGNVAHIGLQSYGEPASSDRALGSRASGNTAGYDPVQFGVRLTNGTGQTLTQAVVSFRGEQWFKASSASAHTLTIQYKLGGGSLTDGTWVSVPALTFTAPQSTAGAAFLIGNESANRVQLSTTLSGISWPAGGELWVRFTDANQGGTEQGLAIDDFVLSTGGTPPTISLVGPGDGATGLSTSVNLQATVGDAGGEPLTVTFYGRRATPAPGPDFTLVTLPDTQHYSENSNGMRLNNFISQTSWIVSQKNALNVAFVAHMGDMVQNGDILPDNITLNIQEWINADFAMDIIEQPGSTLTAYGIPWGGAPGNHDYEPTGDPNGTSIYWNQFFGIRRFLGRPYYRGTINFNPFVPYEEEDIDNGDNNNNYQFFSASGLDFIVINLGYRTSADPAILDWADALLKAHPHRRGIITSHWLVNATNPANPPGTNATFGGPGLATYEALKDNPNLFMMLSGHVPGEGKRVDTFQGRNVYSNLQDYQGRADGGASWIRYYVFSPANNTIQAKTYRTTTGQFEVDADSDFTMAYDMQSPFNAWVELGEASVPGGGTSASFNWTGLEEGGHFEWYAVVSDGGSPVASGSRDFTVLPNALPTVSLTSPAQNQVFNIPSTVTLTATAADTDGSIARVEFFVGNDKVNTDSNPPYQYVWSPPNGGDYVLTAVAVDQEGAVGLSNVVPIEAVNPGNIPPTITLDFPAPHLTAALPAAAKLMATATDSDGAVTKVEFYQNGVFLGQSTAAPYILNWTVYSPGTYNLTAKVFDDDAGFATSAAVPFTVFVPAPTSFTGVYTQNFTSLGASGTVPPAGWVARAGVPGTHSGTWETEINAAGNNGVDSMVSLPGPLTAVSTPSSTRNTGYNSGAPGDANNRMLATAPGTSPTPESLSVSGSAFDLMLTNDAGGPISSLRVGYDIQRFNAPGTANELPGYWLFYSLDNGASWTNVSALNPTLAGPEGVIVPNTVGVTSVPPTPITLGSPWTMGARLILRWVDDNSSTGADQLYGLDNVLVQTEGQPLVGMNAPAAGAVFAAPASVPLSAIASDPGGNIVGVEFFRDATISLGVDSTPPYSLTWTGVPAGTYSLTAVATDNLSNAATSAPSSIVVQTDTDGDGMSDTWETAHSLNPAADDATQNADGDAFTNLQEFQAGTDPRDHTDVLTLVPIRTVGGKVTLSFETVQGRRYYIEARNDLGDTWSTIVDNLPGTGGVITLADPAAIGIPERFYRAIALP